jgi:hypothetical protein
MSGIDTHDDFQSPDSGEDPSYVSYVVPDVEVSDAPAAEEVVERQLAQYAFVREERDREVRLLFRDTSPSEIARAFRAAGAYLISIMGERAHVREEPKPQAEDLEEPGEDAESERHHHRHGPQPRYSPPEFTGDAVLRYFYSLGETVYTVSIISTSGVVESVAELYPVAARLEREVWQRAAVVFMAGVGRS